MDLKGGLWFIPYMGKELQILLGLEPGDVQVHTQAEISKGNVFSKDDHISQNIFKYSGYGEIMKSEKTHIYFTKFVPLLIPVTIRTLQFKQIHRNNLAIFPTDESLNVTLHQIFFDSDINHNHHSLKSMLFFLILFPNFHVTTFQNASLISCTTPLQ